MKDFVWREVWWYDCALPRTARDVAHALRQTDARAGIPRSEERDGRAFDVEGRDENEEVESKEGPYTYGGDR